MSNLAALAEAIVKGDMKVAIAETQSALDAGTNVQHILDKGLIAATVDVGKGFQAVLQLLRSMLKKARQTAMHPMQGLPLAELRIYCVSRNQDVPVLKERVVKPIEILAFQSRLRALNCVQALSSVAMLRLKKSWQNIKLI